jgi:hypothetical protein
MPAEWKRWPSLSCPEMSYIAALNRSCRPSRRPCHSLRMVSWARCQ